MRGVLLLLAMLLAGCSDPGESTPAPEPELEVAWREVTPPLPPGASGRVAVRDATFCGGQWYVVGALYDSAQNTRPAAWRSPDGTSWTQVRFAPATYWGERHILSSVSCRDGRVAMIGAKSGGAHGSPRTGTWYAGPDGVMTEVIAGFSLYGGSQAVNVGRMVSGDSGWLIVGNRTSGAAVWVSADATEFTLIDSDPQLSSDPRADTAGRDVVSAGGQWTVVGSGTVRGRLPRIPMAWVSADGRTWTRQDIAAGAEFEDLHRVVAYQGGLLAVGLRGEAFGTWRRPPGGGWQASESFGALAGDRRASPFVSGLTPVNGGLLAAVSDGVRYGLWASPDGTRWQPVTTPVHPTTAGEHIMTVASSDRTVLLLADDAQAGRVWLADGLRYG